MSAPGDTSAWLRLVNEGRDEPVVAEKVRFRRVDWSGAVVVGFLLDNRNVIPGGVILAGKMVNLRQASLAMMTQAAWEQAAPEQRKVLARRWLEMVALAFGEELLDQAPDSFPTERHKSRFRAPLIQLDPSGGVVITAWIREPSVGRAMVKYRRSQYIFSQRGELQSARMIDSEEGDI